MLDASDHNPSLLGQGSSEISRIQIISEDQYAEYIRAKTTINQFADRFEAARDAIGQAREALEELDQAAGRKTRIPSPRPLDKAAKEAADAHDKPPNSSKKSPTTSRPSNSKNASRTSPTNKPKTSARTSSRSKTSIPKRHKPNNSAKTSTRCSNASNANNREAEQLERTSNKVNQAATLLEMAAKFRQIYETQVSLAKRFGTIVEELRHGEDQNRRLLPSLAETQEKNREALDEFKAELRRRAEALPNDDPGSRTADRFRAQVPRRARDRRAGNPDGCRRQTRQGRRSDATPSPTPNAPARCSNA